MLPVLCAALVAYQVVPSASSPSLPLPRHAPCRLSSSSPGASPARDIPHGAIYEGEMRVPFLGAQHVRLTKLRHGSARVDLHGIVGGSGIAKTDFDGTTGSVRFSVDATLSALLRKYRVDIPDAKYWHEEDVATLVLHIKLLRYKHTLVLRRVAYKPPWRR